MRGYNIYITVPDGDPSGLRIVTKSSWTGKIFAFPRALLPKVLNDYKLDGVGVYFLIVSYETPPIVYVGEADGLKDRLLKHHRNSPEKHLKEEATDSSSSSPKPNSSNEEGIDFSHVIIFTEGCKDIGGASFLNKAIVQYLESKLIEKIREAKKARLANQNTPKPPTLSEGHRIEAEGILGELLQVLPLLGLDIFGIPKGKKPDSGIFILRKTSKRTGPEVSIEARLKVIGGKFVVLRDSQAFATETESCSPSYKELRRQLLDNGVLVRDPNNPDILRFSQDYEFQTPSQAAAVVYGGNQNGLLEWRLDDGTTLGQFMKTDLPNDVTEMES